MIGSVVDFSFDYVFVNQITQPKTGNFDPLVFLVLNADR